MTPPPSSLATARTYGVYLPPLSLLLSLFLLSTSVHLSRASSLFPPPLTYPPLSLAGIYSPSLPHCYLYFAFAFTTIALSLAYIEGLHWALLSHTHHVLKLKDTTAATAAATTPSPLHTAHTHVRYGFLGLALVGILPLQGWGELATTAHVLSSLLFFAASLSHGYTFLATLASPEYTPSPLSLHHSPSLWYTKAACLASGFLSFLPAQLLHPGGTPLHPHPGGAELADIDAAGFGQWWFVASLMLYYTSFAWDFAILASGDVAPAAPPPEGGGGEVGKKEE